MNRLSETFGDRIDFIHLNIDSSESLPMRQRYELTGRTQYALLNAEGEVVLRWYGPLDEDAIMHDLENFLTNED